MRGVPTFVSKAIKWALKMEEGELPIKYLEVPLASKKLPFNQLVKPLIEKMVARVDLGLLNFFLKLVGFSWLNNSYYYAKLLEPKFPSS